MPVPTKPNKQQIRRDSDFIWEQFAKDCVNNRYVLVIGSEAILNKNVNPEAEGNSMKLLFDLTLRYKASLDVGEGNEEEEFYRLKSRVKSFTELVRKYNYQYVRELVLDTIRNTDFEPCFDEEIEPSLMKLLQKQCFRIVLATSIDPYIEIAMERVWGKGNFDVVQIENAQQLFKQVVSDEFGVIRPTLCYVFGKVNAEKSLSENRFVLSENDAMEKISSWFENQKSNRFLRFIRTFRLVSVGCQFDDWMFRFFWFLLRGRVNTEADGQVAVEIKDDYALKQYLEQEKVKVFANARLFMNNAIESIDKVTDLNSLPRKDRGVFISYAHEDRYIALPLFERLHAAGVNVWIDENKNHPGDPFEPRIHKAIMSCKVFMPILSTQIKNDLLTNHHGWYKKEWNMAQERYESLRKISGTMNFKIIPIVIGDYRFNEAYHQQLPDCIIDATAFEAAKDNIENLIQLINM